MSYNKIKYGDFMKKEKININFGNKIRMLREDNGYSQYDFAFECGISDAYYGRIERGEYSPTLKLMNKIAKTLGITLSELLKNVDK